MSAAGIDTRLLELLQRASNLELFELNAVIERMLADPRRILQVRKDLHLGQSVRFMDWRDGRMRVGKVIAFKDTQLTLQEEGTRSAWTVPYTAVEPPAAGAHGPVPAREPSPAARVTRGNFHRGDKVAFEDKHSTPWWASSCASTSAPPPSIPVTGPPGAWASHCCATCSTSEPRRVSRGP